MRQVFELKDLQPGDHACLLTSAIDEQGKVLAPFIEHGLGRGERCLYIANEQLDIGLEHELARQGLELARLRQEGRAEVLNRYHTFLRYARFEPILMIELLERAVRDTLERGYTGLRVVADMSWALIIGCDQLIAFEALLNDYTPNWKLTILCYYNLSQFPPQILQDVLRTHPVALVGDRTCPNVFYEPPALVLGEQGSAARIDWMMTTLKKNAALLVKGCNC